nr:acetyl-CoA carboxylase biotin carboxyl carrier protein subunit [Xanthomonadales bacterium]
MEAMKMEITLRAPHAGKVVDLRATPGDFVEADVLLAKVEAA